MPERRAITTLLPRVATGTLLILLVGTFVSNNDVTGSLNKPMYLGILVLGFALTILFLYSQRSTWLDSVLALLASVGMVWGIWTIERPWLVGPFWNGFGESVAIGVLVVLFVLGMIVPRPTLLDTAFADIREMGLPRSRIDRGDLLHLRPTGFDSDVRLHGDRQQQRQ